AGTARVRSDGPGRALLRRGSRLRSRERSSRLPGPCVAEPGAIEFGTGHSGESDAGRVVLVPVGVCRHAQRVGMRLHGRRPALAGSTHPAISGLDADAGRPVRRSGTGTVEDETAEAATDLVAGVLGDLRA